MTERIAIASRDRTFAAWLSQVLGLCKPYGEIRTLDCPADADAPWPRVDTSDTDVLVVHAAFATDGVDGPGQGTALVRELRARPDCPALLVIAEQGNELTAVRALHCGAEDYLPRGLLTRERLAEMVNRGIEVAERRRAFARRESAGGGATGIAGAAPLAGRLAAGGEVRPLALPGYEILRQIGASGNSTVYLALSAARGHNVALKVSRHETEISETAREMLAREYGAITQIDHPSVVKIHDYGVHAGHEYLAMEYFPRGDLRTRMNEKLPVAAAAAYARRIAAALQVVHDAGLVHRDLKPQNVMLRDDDEIVLIDFGLSKFVGGGTSGATRTGVLRGSPYYMSPEHAQGLPLDGRSDLYGLGVVLFEMLSRRKPFHGDTALAVLQAHVSDPIPALPEDVAVFQPLVERLMAKRPNDRFDTAAAVVAALAGY